MNDKKIMVWVYGLGAISALFAPFAFAILGQIYPDPESAFLFAIGGGTSIGLCIVQGMLWLNTATEIRSFELDGTIPERKVWVRRKIMTIALITSLAVIFFVTTIVGAILGVPEGQAIGVMIDSGIAAIFVWAMSESIAELPTTRHD